jgi:tetratricopeptide (TPR) repeat protein
MASKSSTVILPVVFCLVAWWIEGRWQWRNLARVAPVFLLAVAASAVSIWTQGFSLAAVTDPMFTRTGPERVVTAGVAVWFYLGKLFWPHPLMALYPRWHFDATKGSSWLPVLAVFIALFILGRKRESWARAPFFVFAYFLAALLPALGLLDNYIFHYSLVFDHFQYLAGMGPMALAAVGLVRLACLVNLGRTWLRSSLGAVVLLILGLLSFQRAAVFRSELTLWGDTLAKYPDSWPADYDYGLALAEAGRHDEAKRHFERMLELYPNCPEGHISLGLSLLDEGHADAAIAEFETALKINPNSGEAYNNIGDALLKKGKEDEAMAEFAKAAEVSPYLAEASYNYGQILLKKGMRDAAIAEFQEALHADPDMATAHYDLGRAYARKGQNDAAIEEFQACLDIEPNDEDACNNLGLVLVQMGRMAEGVARYQQALAINPNSASAHSNLGAALFQMGQKEEATVHLRRALEIDPNSEEANNNLGNAFLAGGQLDAAIAQYQKALAIHPTFIDAHRNLGVALLCKGQARDSIVQLAEVARQIPNDRVTQDLLAKAQALARPKPAGK